MLTVGGLFSGIGGIELGFEQAGFKINWSNEIDENCAKTFKFNHKHNFTIRSIHIFKMLYLLKCTCQTKSKCPLTHQNFIFKKRGVVSFFLIQQIASFYICFYSVIRESIIYRH